MLVNIKRPPTKKKEKKNQEYEKCQNIHIKLNFDKFAC